MIGIYKITSPSGKVYVGQSKDIKKRWSAYSNNLAKGQRILNRSFLKYGIDSHIFEVIEECNIEMLNEKERYWQDFYNAMGKNGMNCVLTETNCKKRQVSEYFSKTLIHRNKTREWTPDARRKIAEKQKVRMLGNSFKKGFKHSDEFKQKRRSLMLGNKQTLGHKYTQEHKDKLSKASTRKILLLDTNTGIFYESIKEASFVFGYKSNTLAMKLKGYKNKWNNTSLIIV